MNEHKFSKHSVEHIISTCEKCGISAYKDFKTYFSYVNDTKTFENEMIKILSEGTCKLYAANWDVWNTHSIYYSASVSYTTIEDFSECKYSDEDVLIKDIII